MSESNLGASPKSRPILFSGPMVRALLEGRKTQTRRIIKPQPHPISQSYGDVEESDRYPGEFFQWKNGEPLPSFDCPYGKPGDLLWVRETFTRNGFKVGEKVFYRADAESQFMGEMRESNGNITRYHTDHWEKNGVKRKGGDWKPSIHMPRWASRLTLELTDVRVERLQDISVADAKMEGIFPVIDTPGVWGNGFVNFPYSNTKSAFIGLWCAVNGQLAWKENPWVWAVAFKVHQCNVDALLKREAA